MCVCIRSLQRYSTSRVSFTTQPEAKGAGGRVKCTEFAFAAALSRFVCVERESTRAGEEGLCRGVRC
jgi:hypothetical protein